MVEAFQNSLKQRDVYVAPSERWADPRAKLLSGGEWETARPRVLRTLGLPSYPEEYVAELERGLGEAYRRTADNAPHNDALRVVANKRGSEALWGGGELASVDCLRFVVPVRTINAGPNPRYFGRG